MADRLLIIESGKLPAESSMIRLVAQENGLCCDMGSWESFQPESLRQCGAALVVVMAEADPGKALTLFQWLRVNPSVSPTLAILPSNSDSEFLRAASEASADFMLAPIRKNELRFRMRRIQIGRAHV